MTTQPLTPPRRPTCATCGQRADADEIGRVLLASCLEVAEFFESTEKVDREYHTEHGTLHLFTTDPLLVRLRAAIVKAQAVP